MIQRNVRKIAPNTKNTQKVLQNFDSWAREQITIRRLASNSAAQNMGF
jgi:hypothetical protein